MIEKGDRWLVSEFDTPADRDGIPTGKIAPVKGAPPDFSQEVLTTQPVQQGYTGNYLGHRTVCLENQHIPDSSNQPDYLSVMFVRGKDDQELVIFRFR